MNSLLLFSILCTLYKLTIADTETIFNDPSNENRAADMQAVGRAGTTTATLVIIAACALLSWWIYGTFFIDRDVYFARKAERERVQLEQQQLTSMQFEQPISQLD